ncbi:hypothetical protein BLNAU_20008 [Blattamonas nauphoetae]|uniref:Uncharacterized protein n=1 Tax=Blattamonas nauphoetae TaxID=2049346 RepID=A0ABQ9X0G3_9EUKA|nr:hypothetical protein BLNAU_20008 [Blattamonas nauphoetae]
MSIHPCFSSFASVSNRQTIPVTNPQLPSLKFSEPNQASEHEFIFANKTGLAAAKIAEICNTPLHMSLLRLICFSAVDFGSDSVTFVGSAIHFASTLLSQPLSSHSFEGCDAKEQPSLTTMLRTSDASCARCFKNIVMHQRKHLDKESERGGRGKDGRRGGTERRDTETAGTRERAEGTRKDFATQQTDRPSATWHALRQTSPASPHHTRRAHSKGGDCDWGRRRGAGQI